jgi:hypothetical protein
MSRPADPGPAGEGAPADLIFPWKSEGAPLGPKLVAIVLVGGAFAAMFSLVSIRVSGPERTEPRQASLIYLRDDAQGRALQLKAREGGPFPSRFDPLGWDGLAEVERKALRAALFPPRNYVPQLRDLPPETRTPPVKLAPRGVAFFPERGAKPAAAAAASARLAPLLYPLSVSAVAALPKELPPFPLAADAAGSPANWRFLVRLNAAGGVAECVSLAKSGEPGGTRLEAWLREVRFLPAPRTPSRWIALGVGFANQPTDATDSR